MSDTIVERLRSPLPTAIVNILHVLIRFPDPHPEVIAEEVIAELERLCEDRTCVCLYIPYSFGELRLLAGEALSAVRAKRGDVRPIVLADVPRPLSSDQMEPFRNLAGLPAWGGPRPLERYRILRDGGYVPTYTFRFDPHDHIQDETPNAIEPNPG